MAARAIPGSSYGYSKNKNKDAEVKICDITVGEVIFQIENGQYKNLEQLVSLLIVVWTCLASRVDSFQDVQGVFQFIYRETGKAIFSKEFLEINQNYKRGLSRILVQCSEVLESKVPNVAKLCSSMIMCIYDPWSDPAISEVISNENIDENLVADFVSLEPIDLLLLRIESLVNIGLENSAIRLCRFCLKSASLARAIEQQQKESICMVENWKLPFIEWLLRILFRKRLINEFVAESAVCNCHDGVMLINNVQKCNMPDSEAFAETLINVFLVRDLLFQKSYCCTKELMVLWCDIQVNTNKSIEEVKEASRQLLNGHASTSAHFYLFIDCLWEKYGTALIPLYLEMFIRGLSSDLNFLEAAREVDDKEAVIEIENNMAAVYLKISTLLCDISKEVSLECMLSSFSLDPTQEKLDLIRRLSFEITAEKNKRTLANSRLKASGSSRCGKDQDTRTVLAGGLPKRKSCVLTCDRGVQVGESPYINDNILSSSTEGCRDRRIVTAETESDVRDVMSSMVSSIVEFEPASQQNTKHIMETVKDVMDECLACVIRGTSLGFSDRFLNASKMCNPEELIPQISNSEFCMEFTSSISEPSQEPPCLTPIYKDLDETSLTNDERENSDSTKDSVEIHIAVNELIGVVVDALGHNDSTPVVEPSLHKQLDTDFIKGTLIARSTKAYKSIGKEDSNHCNVDLIDDKITSVVENAETRQVLKLCDDKITKESSSFPNICDIDFTDQPIITNGPALLNGNLSGPDNISADISKSKNIIDNQMLVSSNSIIDAHSVNGLCPTLNGPVCDKTAINHGLHHRNNSLHRFDQEESTNGGKQLTVESRVCNCGEISCNTLAPSNKLVSNAGHVTCTPTVPHSVENTTPDSHRTSTLSHFIKSVCGDVRRTPTGATAENDRVSKHCHWRKCYKVDHLIPFHHVVLEADIPGVSRALLTDFVIVLESLRNPELKSTKTWNKLKDVCKEYLQRVTSQRCKFLNSQLNESVDSEGDSASEMSAIGAFASFQSDSVCNDPHVDKAPVLRRFMNDKNNPNCNAFMNLSDVQNLYMPLDRLLRADASSSHHDHLKHHRKHRSKDPKKQALRHLRHNARHNRDVIKKKKKKRRKGKKEKSRSKKHHSTHNKNGRDVTNKKKRRLKKKKDSPLDPNGDYCSDFNSAELMRLVREHSSNFPQVTASSTPQIHNNISSGESDLLLNCVPSKKKSKQVNFKAIKAKKNAIVKSHEKHKHNKSKPERRDKKKSPNITKLNAVKDYSHFVQFSSVKQMQSVQIRQSSVAVDLANVNNDTQNHLALREATAHPENIHSSVDPSVKTCSQEELMNIQMLLANKQADRNNEDHFGKSFLISSNKQSCSVLKYVSSKTTSRLLSVAQATNQLVMPNCESDASLNDNTLMPPNQFQPRGSKALLDGKSITAVSEHIPGKALVPIAMSASQSKIHSRNIKKYTSHTTPLITAVSFPMAQSMQSAGNKLVAGKLVIPLGGCVPSTSGISTLPRIGEIVVTASSGVHTSPTSSVFIVKGNTSPQLSVQSLLAASRNSNNLKIPIPPALSCTKNMTYLNKGKPNALKKVVKKYMPCIQKAALNSETCKRKRISDCAPLAIVQHPRLLPALAKDVPQPVITKSKAEPIVETIIEIPMTVPLAPPSLNEVIKSIIHDLVLAVINSDLWKTETINSSIMIKSTVEDLHKKKDVHHPTGTDSVSDSTVDSRTILQSAEIPTELPLEQELEEDTSKATVLSPENSLKEPECVDQMSESSSDSTLATTSTVNLKGNVTAVKSAVKSPEHKTTFFSESLPVSSSSPFGTSAETTLITNTTFSTPRSIAACAAKANRLLTVEKLQPLTISVSSSVRPQGAASNSSNKVEGLTQTDTPTRSLTSISDAVRFSLMDMDDATGSVENQVLQAFNAFPQETVGYGNPVSVNASEASPVSSAASQIVTQSSESFQASIATSQSDSFAECQISASTTTEWTTNDALVSPGAGGKSHETDSANEMKDDEPIKKKRKKKDKIERDPDTLQRFWCEICNRGFFSAYNLRRHCRNVHKMDLPKGTSDVPFTTSNSQCLAQIGARVICTTVPDGESQPVSQQMNIASKTPEFLLHSPTHDPKTKEFALQTSPPTHPKASQNINQSPSNFTLHSPPPSTPQTPSSLPISPAKDFRLQPATSVALGQPQHTGFMPVTNTIPKPVPKFQRLQNVSTTTPPTHGLPRIGTVHQPSATSQTAQPTGMMQSSNAIPKPPETQATNLVQPLPCQVQQIQQTTQCALSQGKKQDQRAGMLQAAQHAAQEQALRQARHAAELQQVQRAMQQAKKSVAAAAQLSKAEVLQQSQNPIQPTSAALSHLQTPILNPQMQKLVQIRQAALCGTPEFALQLSNQTGTSDIHTSPIKSPLQYFQAQVPSTQHPAILHSAVRQTLASCAATRQNQANQSFPGQQIQNMSNAEFLSRIVPHSNPERSSCSQTFPAMSAADLCLVSSQMHMPLIRQTSETNEGLEDLEQFLLENMPWSGEQITSQGIVQHSLNRMGADPVALPIPVKPGAVVMQQPKNLSLVRNKQTISKPKPYKPPVPSLTKNLGGSKGSSVKKKAALKKAAADVLSCNEGAKTGFVPSVGNINAKNVMHCPKAGAKSMVGCPAGAAAETNVSSNLNENDSHSSDSVQCIEITQSSQITSKGRGINSVSTSFNPFPQRESSGMADVPGFYNVSIKRPDHPVHCTPGLTEPPRANLLINNLNSTSHISNTQHTIPQLSSAISPRHPTIPKPPALNLHCNDHVLGLPISKSPGAKINCTSKLPPKPPMRKFSEPLPKPTESLTTMEKCHDQVNPVIPIFDPNPLQNDNVDAEKEFNNLQSKISDCEKHLKNSESKEESKNCLKNDKDSVCDSVTIESSSCGTKVTQEINLKTQLPKEPGMNNQEQKLSDLSPEKPSNQSADVSKLSSPTNKSGIVSDKSNEKIGKVPKGIHFLDEQNESNNFDSEEQEKNEAIRSDSMMPKNCITELCTVSQGSFVMGTSLTPKTTLPFPFSHSEHVDSLNTCHTQSNSVPPTLCYNSTSLIASDNSLNLPCVPAKTCHSAFESNDLKTSNVGARETKDFDQKNGNTLSVPFPPNQSMDHINQKTEQNMKSAIELLATEKNVYSNIFSASKLLEVDAKKSEGNSIKNDIFLSPNRTPPKESVPVNGKDMTMEKESLKCQLKQSSVQNSSFKGEDTSIGDIESDAEHQKTGDISISPTKQGEFDGQATLGRTRLRDTPKTSVKRSCPCCTDSSIPKKCLVRSSKMISPTKINSNNSKTKNLLVIKTKLTNGPAAPVQTRSSHRLRSKTGT